MTTFAQPLKPGETTLGVALLDNIKTVVAKADAGTPRSLQTAIGPSEYGTPCPRKLAYKMLGHPVTNLTVDPWARVVGTAVHAWMAFAFGVCNETMADGRPRYLIEQRVNVLPGLAGNVDLYDRQLRVVVDFKFPGLTAVRKARAARDVGPQYRAQVQGYAQGYLEQGEQVDHVAVAMIPKAGILSDSYIWTDVVDPAVVTAAAGRQAAALAMAQAFDVEHHPDRYLLIPAVENHCSYCDFYLPGGQGADGCPGGQTQIPPHVKTKG